MEMPKSDIREGEAMNMNMNVTATTDISKEPLGDDARLSAVSALLAKAFLRMEQTRLQCIRTVTEAPQINAENGSYRLDNVENRSVYAPR